MAIFKKISNGRELTDCQLYEYLLTAKGYCCEKGWQWEDLDTEEIKTGREWLKYWQLNGNPCGGCVAPEFTEQPYITFESLCVGQPLSIGTLVYTGTEPVTPSYQWIRNDEPIDGATSDTYITTEDDLGVDITCFVVITNACGQAILASNYITGLGAVPVNIFPPTIAGTGAVGDAIFVNDNGGWTNLPSGYQYKWYRDGYEIAGEVLDTYITQVIDIETTITCKVQAENDCGLSVPFETNGVYIPKP